MTWAVDVSPLEILNYLFGASGVAIGLYSLWQARQAPARLRYRMKRTWVASRFRDERVGLTFEGRPVPRVHKLTVTFRNAGRQRINKGDIERPRHR